MDICCQHAFRECEEALKSAVELYDRTPKQEVTSRKRNWSLLLFKLREFFQTAEILSHFNSHCTQRNLQEKGILKGDQQPTCQQLCRNFINEGGNVCFRKKWPLIRREILSPLNRWGAAQHFRKNPNVHECAIHYLEIGGLDRFWAAHPEFLRQEEPELTFDEEAMEEKNAA
jgi:hypothetical protein